MNVTKKTNITNIRGSEYYENEWVLMGDTCESVNVWYKWKRYGHKERLCIGIKLKLEKQQPRVMHENTQLIIMMYISHDR